jgi:CRISPR-associated endoribonuclease Cas6
MLGSIRVGLSAESEIRLRGLGGEALHGLFFNMLKRNSVEVASNLHGQKDQKPFSLSPLLEGYELRESYAVIPGGGGLAFRLSFLSDEVLAAATMAFFMAMTQGEVLYLSRKPVMVENIDMSEGKFSSFSEVLKSARPETKIILEFLSPTSFRRSGVQILFPEPRLVFSSLLKRWNTFSETKLPEEYAEGFASIKVSNYNLHTELVQFSKYKIIGFKGRIEYELPQEFPEPCRQAVNALADFAFYAGTGAKTAMGMGQTKRISPKTN